MDFASKIYFYNRASKGAATPDTKIKITVKMPNMKVFYEYFRDLVETLVHSK
jgi:hypothetical protein